MPLLLDIHGGPHGFVGNYFSLSHFYRYALASQGWTVLALNPSGSGSYGEAFANSICGRWGEFDMPEHLAAIDELVAEGIAHPDLLAVAGYSYGGYMAAWMIGYSDRFRAAVVGAPIVNLESLHGTSDIGMWYCFWEMQGDIVSNRDRFRRLSPVNYVDQVTTPTLILHGEADERCPISQGEELFIGLLAVGRVPVEFVRYPESSHLFLSSGWPRHRVDYHRRVMSWLEHYVNSQGSERKQNGE
jgi:dipeptidyl aminopeptidase/acylaminoacyl peptidase